MKRSRYIKIGDSAFLGAYSILSYVKDGIGRNCEVGISTGDSDNTVHIRVDVNIGERMWHTSRIIRLETVGSEAGIKVQLNSFIDNSILAMNNPAQRMWLNDYTV